MAVATVFRTSIVLLVLNGSLKVNMGTLMGLHMGINTAIRDREKRICQGSSQIRHFRV